MSILIFILVLLLLVLVHEFGHFIVAKRAGIRVDEFAFGFPPRLFSKKWGETNYAFNALPIGGYVKIYGENPDDVAEGGDVVRSFAHKPRYIQALVIIAGIVCNIILAWLLIAGTLMIGISAPVDPASYAVTNAELTVTDIQVGSPAGIAGLLPGDQIVSLMSGGETVTPIGPEGVSSFIGPREGSEVIVAYKRNGEDRSIVVVPKSGIVEGRAAIGISMDMVGILKLPLHKALWMGAQRTYDYTILTAQGLFVFFRDALIGKGDFTQVTGPVGMVQAVGTAAGMGFSHLLLFTALISINLAVINVLPFPALDGGRLLFVIIEAIMRKPIPAAIANRFNVVGFALLMLLMLAVTWHDISRLMH